MNGELGMWHVAYVLVSKKAAEAAELGSSWIWSKYECPAEAIRLWRHHFKQNPQ